MPQVVAYKIVSGTLRKVPFSKNSEGIEEQVLRHMQEGWVPLGGLSSGGGVFVQAMVKYAEQAS